MKNKTILEQNWALIDPDEKIVETFHNKDTAKYWRGKLEKVYVCDLKIKYIGE